jgi:glycosyltransferase involved in cell wall biosynthesis
VICLARGLIHAKILSMISIVVPVYNEEESLPHFHDVLLGVLKMLKDSYEIIYVDDGSKDSSLTLLKKLAKEDKNISVYSFRMNQGKAEALTLGFQKAVGDYIVTLDADLQDRPEEIPHLLEKIDDEWDIVSGWRKDRQDKKKMVAISRIFNRMVKRFWGLDIHDYNCGLKIYTRDAAKSLRLYGGMHRFIPLIAHNNGFQVTEMVVRHEPRKYGHSKYGFSKIKDAPDIFTMLFLGKYSKRPLHFFGTIGGVMLLIGALIFIYLAFIHYAFGAVIGRRPLLLFSMLLIISGLQVFFTGFIAELLTNIANRDYRSPTLRYSSAS